MLWHKLWQRDLQSVIRPANIKNWKCVVLAILHISQWIQQLGTSWMTANGSAAKQFCLHKHEFPENSFTKRFVAHPHAMFHMPLLSLMLPFAVVLTGTGLGF